MTPRLEAALKGLANGVVCSDKSCGRLADLLGAVTADPLCEAEFLKHRDSLRQRVDAVMTAESPYTAIAMKTHLNPRCRDILAVLDTVAISSPPKNWNAAYYSGALRDAGALRGQIGEFMAAVSEAYKEELRNAAKPSSRQGFKPHHFAGPNGGYKPSPDGPFL